MEEASERLIKGPEEGELMGSAFWEDGSGDGSDKGGGGAGAGRGRGWGGAGPGLSGG